MVLGISLFTIATASLVGVPSAQAADANCPAAAGSYAGGTGTSGDPFLISTDKRITITCKKGKQVKKVTGVKPKCPSGWKRVP